MLPAVGITVKWSRIEHERVSPATDGDQLADLMHQATMYRAPIKGGWLVMFMSDFAIPDDLMTAGIRFNGAPTMTFVPDPRHSWKESE